MVPLFPSNKTKRIQERLKKEWKEEYFPKVELQFGWQIKKVQELPITFQIHQNTTGTEICNNNPGGSNTLCKSLHF